MRSHVASVYLRVTVCRLLGMDLHRMGSSAGWKFCLKVGRQD